MTEEEGVVVNCLPEKNTAVVEVFRTGERFSVALDAIKALLVDCHQSPQAKGPHCRAGRYFNPFLTAPEGRCVTIGVPDWTESAGPLDYPRAQLLELSDSHGLTSNTMLPGTIVALRGNFVIISSSFLEHHAVASLDVLQLSHPMPHPSATSAPLINLETAADVVRYAADPEGTLIGCLTQFALRGGGHLVMEGFISNYKGGACCGKDLLDSECSARCQPSTNEVDPNGSPPLAVRGTVLKAPRGLFVGSFGGAFAAPAASVGALAPVKVEGEETVGGRGQWKATGTAVHDFFHPELCISFAVGEVQLAANTPPVMSQGEEFTVELWCFWLMEDCEVCLLALDENGQDLTEAVLDVRVVHVPQDTGITLDCLASRPVLVFHAKWKDFKVARSGCSEVTLCVHARRGAEEVRIHSKPVFLRNALPPDAIGQRAMADPTSLAYKYWVTDLLGPNDRIVDGFMDPGRSNHLCKDPAGYEALPMIEREVIVVDGTDSRLRSIAASCRGVIGGMLDLQGKVLALSWLVASCCGGDRVSDFAEDAIASLRGTKATRKRARRGEAPRNANVVRLGDVHHGVCRHRALLFKYLCDYNHVPCFLVRGEHRSPNDAESERHSWNVVPLEGTTCVLVDTTLSPLQLLPWPSPCYQGPSVAVSDWENCHVLSLRSDTHCLHVLEECGRGATAMVRRATIAGLTCAVKIPRSKRDLTSLIKEYTILRSLSGVSSIVQCLGWSQGIVLEYFPLNLLTIMNRLIVRQRRLSYSQQRSVLLGVLAALSQLHSRRIVHRDVKSENVLAVVIHCAACLPMGLVCQLCDLRVKLADLADCAQTDGRGLCTAIDRVGTPPYTSPELEAEVPFSTASDLWSVGVLAVEMANMQLPSLHSPTATRVQDPYTPGATIVMPQLDRKRGVPAWLTTLVAQTLVPAWKERKATAKSLLEMLRAS